MCGALRKQFGRGHLDLHDHDSTIKRADGTVPYNGYLWPMSGDSWWIAHDREYRGFAGMWNFSVVALDDGRYSVDGTVWQIEHNDRNPADRHLPGHVAVPVVFDTRIKALRVAVARMIRTARASARVWKVNTLTTAQLETLVNWALGIVARETSTHPRVFSVPRAPEKPSKTGLDLFDQAGVSL